MVRKRRTAALGTLLLVISLVGFLALPALAHTPRVTASCAGLLVKLTSYNTRNDNSVKVTIDGVVAHHDSDFGSSYEQFFPWDDTKDHSYLVEVLAWDDPNSTKGWSVSIGGSQQACRTTTTTAPPTTTTTQPPTTTTTQPPTTTTTQPPTTTTTQPPTTTTTQPPTTTTTQPPTTTTTQPPTTTTTLPPTTTTTQPPTTTTTTQPEVTTTTQQITTTTLAETTTTVETEVAGIQVSAPVAAQATQATLPFTGVSSAGLALIAAALAGLGVLLLALSKKVPEGEALRSWS